MPLSSDELQRYARQIVLPGFGREGQERLRASSILIVGLGGLGSPAALYLAAAGAGRLGILDFDKVAVHNLQRQILHDSASIGLFKTESASARIEALNPHVQIDSWQTVLDSGNARGIVSDYDVVIDGTDSFSTRYLINDACVLEGRPVVQASIHRFEGQLSVYGARGGPCYRCVHPEPPPAGSVPNCAEGGVLGVLPGVLGALQGVEAIKLLTGVGDSLVGRLLVFDALGMRFREFGLRQNPDCPWCGTRERTELLDDYRTFCGETVPDMKSPSEIEPAELERRIRRGEPIQLIDVREEWEYKIGNIETSRLIPMARIPGAISNLAKDETIVVYCHHGMRSAMVADYLRASGFSRVLNLTGGVDRWSVDVDMSVPRY